MEFVCSDKELVELILGYMTPSTTWWPFPCMCVKGAILALSHANQVRASNRCPMGQKRGKERGNKKPKRFSKEFVVQIETTTTTVCFYCYTSTVLCTLKQNPNSYSDSYIVANPLWFYGFVYFLKENHIKVMLISFAY